MPSISKLFSLGSAIALACLPLGSHANNGGGDDYSCSRTSSFESDYLFTINYKFGGASSIITTPGVVENINTFVGAEICGPAFNGYINKGVITNRFVNFEGIAIVFEEATWYGSFDNGDKGNGTFIATTSGLVDFQAYEQQRVTFVLDDGDKAWLQYSYVLCGSIAFDLRTASAAQDCYRTIIGNQVVLPPIFSKK